MGTDKRERQKANKALRQQQEEKAEQRGRYGRIALYVGLAIAGILILVVTVNLLSGDDDSSDTIESADAATEAPAATDGNEATGDAEGDETQPAEEADPGAPGEEVIPDGCPPAEGTGEQKQEFEEAPPFCLDPEVDYSADITTNLGDFTIAFDQEKAPNTVNNFVFLARNQYFDATECHRIIEGFVVQCGDPTATGTGGPGYQFEDELPEAGEYQLGSVAMANSGPDTNGSQFFIVTGEDGAALPPDYSLFGQVVDGFEDTVKAMEAAGAAGEPVEITTVVIVTS